MYEWAVKHSLPGLQWQILDEVVRFGETVKLGTGTLHQRLLPRHRTLAKKTVRAALRDLEAAGLIIRHMDRRMPGGDGCWVLDATLKAEIIVVHEEIERRLAIFSHLHGPVEQTRESGQAKDREDAATAVALVAAFSPLGFAPLKTALGHLGIDLDLIPRIFNHSPLSVAGRYISSPMTPQEIMANRDNLMDFPHSSPQVFARLAPGNEDLVDFMDDAWGVALGYYDPKYRMYREFDRHCNLTEAVVHWYVRSMPHDLKRLVDHLVSNPNGHYVIRALAEKPRSRRLLPADHIRMALWTQIHAVADEFVNCLRSTVGDYLRGDYNSTLTEERLTVLNRLLHDAVEIAETYYCVQGQFDQWQLASLDKIEFEFLSVLGIRCEENPTMDRLFLVDGGDYFTTKLYKPPFSADTALRALMLYLQAIDSRTPGLDKDQKNQLADNIELDGGMSYGGLRPLEYLCIRGIVRQGVADRDLDVFTANIRAAARRE